jgi:plastocyanin
MNSNICKIAFPVFSMFLLFVSLGAGCGGTTTPTTSDAATDVVATDVVATDVVVPTSDAGVFNGCTEAMFVDRTGAAAERIVAFAGARMSGPFDYAPRCITIAAGQSVTFEGSLTAHPLAPGTSPAEMTAGSPANPISRVDTGNSTVVRFPAAGVFPYFCEYHYAAGMAGVVRVR